MKLLHIDASILGAGSVSREVSALIVRKLVADDSAATVSYRDLSAESLPHLTLATLPTDHPLAVKAGPLDASAQIARDASQQMLEEFVAADTVVIGVPMYNFTVPSQLKAWIDRVVVPGRTFRHGANGAEGLMAGKRVIIAVARGGFYGPQASVSAEHAETYMRTVLGFMGIADPEFVIAEGLSAGENSRTEAVASARAAAGQLAA